MNILEAIAGGPGSIMQGIFDWTRRTFGTSEQKQPEPKVATPSSGIGWKIAGLVAVVGLVYYVSRKA